MGNNPSSLSGVKPSMSSFGFSSPMQFLKNFSTIQAPWQWDDDSVENAMTQLEDDIEGDSKLKDYFEKKFGELKEFLADIGLGEYFQKFKGKWLIVDDLHDLVEKGNFLEMALLINSPKDQETLRDVVKKKLKKCEFTKAKKRFEKMLLELAENNIELGSDASDFNMEDSYISRQHLIRGEKIGSGSFGTVHRGILRLGTNKVCVAIKHVKVHDDADEEIAMSEILIHSQFNHPNILKCFGGFYRPKGSTEDSSRPLKSGHAYMVTELCRHGDLSTFCSATSLGPSQKLSFMRQLADGLSYLHSLDVVHRDLKRENVLVKSCYGKKAYELKICDFGTSRKVSGENVEVLLDKLAGSILYLPPEFMDMDVKEQKKRKRVKKGKDGKKKRQRRRKTGGEERENENMELRVKELIQKAKLGDIYAYGLICWEVWVGENVYSKVIEDMGKRIGAEGGDGTKKSREALVRLFFEMVHGGKNVVRPDLSRMRGASGEVKELVARCWSECLHRRESDMGKVEDQLNEIIECEKEESVE